MITGGALVLALALALSAGVGDAAAFRHEAESFSESSADVSVVAEAGASGGNALRFNNATTATATKTISPSAPTDKVRVAVRGNDLTAPVTMPRFRVLVDGTTAVDEYVTTSYAVYEANRTLSAGSHTVTLRQITPDAGDRTFFDYVEFEGTTDPPGTVIWSGDGEAPINQQWEEIFSKNPDNCAVTPENGIAPNDHDGYFARVTTNPTPLQGTYAYKGKVDDSIVCFQERSELSQTGSSNPKRFFEGEENWEAFGAWLGPDFNIDRDLTGASTFYQHKPNPSDNPNASVNVGDGIFQWVTQGGPSDNLDKDVWTIGTATEEDWYRFVVHTKYSKSASDGLIELYSDVPGGPGGPIVLIKSEAKPTMYTGTNETDWIRTSYGLYREATDSGTETFALDGYTVATTREQAEFSAFGN